MKLNLSSKFILSTILLIIIGMGISTIVSYYNSRNAISEIMNDQKNQIASITVRQIDSWIRDRTLEIAYWGKQDIYNVAIEGAFQRMANLELSQLKSDYEFYEIINVANETGEVVVSSDPDAGNGRSVSNRDYFRESLKGAVFVSDVIKSDGTGKPVFVISAPVRQDEAITGVIFGVIDLDFFTDNFITPFRIGQTGYIFITDAKGMVISHPDKSNIMNLDISQFDYGRKILGGEQDILNFTEGGDRKVATYRKYERMGWYFITASSLSEIVAPGKSLGLINTAITVLVAFFSAMVILIISRSIVKPINSCINELLEGSNLINSSSRQVSSASHTLAEATSQQASSLEETSASLEELSSMAKQNSENAGSANDLSIEATKAAQNGAESMKRLLNAMGEINRSSSEVAKVAKAIEEIAFQTNLLALNAAVEAARAGETGKGFAVVAEEVRNLAQRSSEQVKVTSQLISESTSKVQEGTTQADEVNKALNTINTRIEKVTSIVQDIASASQEQAQGIVQINSSVSELDKTVQQNSASSEQSASASQQMYSQSQELKTIVNRLTIIVEGESALSSQIPAEDKPIGYIKHMDKQKHRTPRKRVAALNTFSEEEDEEFQGF